MEAVTDATFELEVMKSELPVLIDFHADWCEPCKQLTPIVREVAAELEGKVKVVSVDVDKNPMLAESFRVQSIPMLVVIHQGQLAGHQQGVVTKEAILSMLEPVLPEDAAEVSNQDLSKLLTEGRAVAVDIREASAFSRYRIPGAINVPQDELLTRKAELLPSDGRVRVLYARSTDDAKEASKALGEQQVQVAFLTGGFLHWEADGLEVEAG